MSWHQHRPRDCEKAIEVVVEGTPPLSVAVDLPLTITLTRIDAVTPSATGRGAIQR